MQILRQVDTQVLETDAVSRQGGHITQPQGLLPSLFVEIVVFEHNDRPEGETESGHWDQ